MSERLNIKNLIVEPEKIPERPFDPYRDLSPQELGSMRQALAESPDLSPVREIGRMIFLGKQWFSDLASRRKLKDTNPSRFDSSMPAIAYRKVFGLTPVWDFDQHHVNDNLEAFRRSSSWGSLFRYAATARILGYKIELQPEDWQGAKSVFTQKQHLLTGDFLETETGIEWVTWMSIVGAKKVTVPEGGGLKLEFEKGSVDQTQPPIPQSRKF